MSIIGLMGGSVGESIGGSKGGLVGGSFGGSLGGFSGYNWSLWVRDSTMDFWGKVSSLWIFGVVECLMGLYRLVELH